MKINMFDNLLDGRSKIFNIENIQDVFLISDTHFNHNNKETGEDKIAKYCDRPKDWKNITINNWNRVVSDDDTVLHLGDFSLCNKEEAEEVRNQLNGTIYMIKGNHDRHGVGWYRDVGIILSKKSIVMDGYDGIPIIFSHKQKPCNTSILNIHGHQHEKVPFISNYLGNIHINMSVEQINYTPIKFKDLYKGLHLLDNVV